MKYRSKMDGRGWVWTLVSREGAVSTEPAYACPHSAVYGSWRGAQEHGDMGTRERHIR